MSERTGTVLRLLREAGGFISGDRIGRECAISRSAVWKHVGLLRRKGYPIDSCRRRGYRLRGAVNTAHAWEVSGLLATEVFGRSFEYVENIDSTNRLAVERARDGAPEGATIAAESQSSGRGRRGRPWDSPPGKGLYFSIVLRPGGAPSAIGQIPLVAAVALHRALALIAPEVGTLIKWPNDILTPQGRKLAGILCEAALETDLVHYAVVGIGINVNGKAQPRRLEAVASSLAREGGREYPRPLLLAAVLKAFEEDYRRWRQTRSLEEFLPYLERHLALRGTEVTVAAPGGPRRGWVAGIAPGGELLLRDAAGRVVVVSGGDVEAVAPV